jgi:hypothetical protein
MPGYPRSPGLTDTPSTGGSGGLCLSTVAVSLPLGLIAVDGFFVSVGIVQEDLAFAGVLSQRAMLAHGSLRARDLVRSRRQTRSVSQNNGRPQHCGYHRSPVMQEGLGGVWLPAAGRLARVSDRSTVVRSPSSGGAEVLAGS